MKRSASEPKTKLIEQIISGAKKKYRGKKAQAEVTDFIRRYYNTVPPSDLVGESAENLLGAALNHWDLAATRKAHTAKIRVYNPTVAKNGWASSHTIIEIVNDDMPFLVDSIAAELNRLKLTLHLVVHPQYEVERGKTGKLLGLVTTGQTTKTSRGESFMQLQVTAQSGKRLGEIRDRIDVVINDVRACVEDWLAMRQQMSLIVDELITPPKKIAREESDEARQFLEWVHNDHFTFLGYREYDYPVKGRAKGTAITVNRKSGLGVLRDPKAVVFHELRDLSAMPKNMRNFIEHGDLVMVNKSNSKSTVHRPVHMDSIGIKKYDKNGNVVGQRIFVGLFTSSAYNRSPRDIPLLRRKIESTFNNTGFEPASHDGKALLNILETYPRDELFQVSEEGLMETAMGILHLQDRQRVALFARRDNFERFISCQVYVPRDQYSMALRERMQAILSDAFDGEVMAHYAQLGDSPLARLHVIFKTTPGKIPVYDVRRLEGLLIEAARSWAGRLNEALVKAHGEEAAHHLFERYKSAFGAAFQDRFTAVQALADIDTIEHTLESGELGMSLYRPSDAEPDRVGLKVYNVDQAIPLSDVLPMLEDMGLRVLDEVPYRVRLRLEGKRVVMIHDFGLQTRDGSTVNLAAVREKFQQAFARVWNHDIESDGFNALVLRAGLGWREVVVLRAYCKYLRQAGIAYSQDYMEQTLSNNPQLARNIVDMFNAGFDPKVKDGNTRIKRIQKQLDAGLENVVSADEDKIIRRFVNLVTSTLRTNFFQLGEDGGPKPYLSIKLDSMAVDDLPLPRPLREIFVYSPRIEGVHLRFGLVARGGLRWSDRREDFRTEILGLVKAQQVKNTVIVPVGSKGGFVVKNSPPPSDRDAFMAEGIACYKIFISALLDITDNLDGNKIIKPPRTVRRDGDDPYLVVAADKGTATFSDIANGVSQQYGFWLGDAFASGGSVGYDHKGMGITARGGWESVKRHFREMGINTQQEDFDVVGVGDMSGDVFGNGMLLSPHIRLVGAFNHMHIFVDPDPDPAKTIVERRRMFNMPRSSWTDFNTKLLSKGGAIYERSAKTIKLSPQVMARFGIEKETVTPNDLLGALLRAKTDLLWFGGIGTYLKSSEESHAEVGDRANDAIRINARELNCKVIGEGANLGVTQRARVEAALHGVRLYADSIDNSAGVDCSDHEVNIKILIDTAIRNGDLKPARRTALLASMTDEVGLQCLVDNYRQTQAINMILAEGMVVFDNQVRLMRMLERSGRLNREVEFLPDDEVLIERTGSRIGLTGPEVAVLMSYSKIWINEELLASDVPDDPELHDELIAYFPTPLRTKFQKGIMSHRLKREIVATLATNSVVNRGGGSFVNQMMERTGMPASDVVRAYLIARRVLNMRSIWGQIDALDNKVPASIQTDMRLETNKLLDWVTLWFLRNGRRPLDIGSHVQEFTEGFKNLYGQLAAFLPKHYMADVVRRGQPYVDAGVPEDLAHTIAGLVNLFSGCDIIRLAVGRKISVADAARYYYAVGTRFHLGSLRAASDRLEAQNHWQKLAIAALIEEIYSHQLALASQVLDFAGPKKLPSADTAIVAWVGNNAVAVERTEQLISELSSTEINDLAMIAVASRQLRTLAETPAS